MIKIGIVLNEKDQITSFMKATKVAIYEKPDSDWHKTSEITNCFSIRDSMSQMRDFLKELIVELKDCKILIASILTGIPFMMLDKEGFMLCEAEELTEQLLEEIAFDFKKMEQDKNLVIDTSKDYPTRPFETKDQGIYELDMSKLQECHPDISSKKALIPFLKETKFYQLNLYCSHVMPWLDRELPVLGLGYKVKPLEGQGYFVAIEKMCCD